MLDDGANSYTYGIGRISQLELYGNTPEYFITDALGSVRQLTHESSAVLMTQSYDPYGNVVNSSGSVDSVYGYTGEQTDVTGNIYLRARYYNPTDGRFISRDTWSGDVNNPLSLNRWNYTNSNPINYTDPNGRRPSRPCIESHDQECIIAIHQLIIEAQQIKMSVTNGQMMPVEGFAIFTDLALTKFDYDIRDSVWALTLIINGFDANSSWPISLQALRGGTNYSSSFIGENWLPYRDASCEDISWWICSDRGDWKKEYWDKTANQAYHGWFFTASVFFEGTLVANYANYVHEGNGPFDELPVEGPPPQHGKTQEDYALSLKMMELGILLNARYADQSLNEFTGICPPLNSELPFKFRYFSIGSWIRSNLKDHSVYSGSNR